MAYYTNVQADSFYTARSIKPGTWDDLTNTQKTVYLEMASARFDALPWLGEYDTESKRTVVASIEATFYEYVRYIAECGGRTSTSIGEVKDEDELNVLNDLPRNVASRIIPYLDPARLTVEGTIATVQVGDTMVNFNPAEETASEAAERFARARHLDARTGEIFTEMEQENQRPMRAMSFGDGPSGGGSPTSPGSSVSITTIVTKHTQHLSLIHI